MIYIVNQDKGFGILFNYIFVPMCIRWSPYFTRFIYFFQYLILLRRSPNLKRLDISYKSEPLFLILLMPLAPTNSLVDLSQLIYIVLFPVLNKSLQFIV